MSKLGIPKGGAKLTTPDNDGLKCSQPYIPWNFIALCAFYCLQFTEENVIIFSRKSLENVRMDLNVGLNHWT